MAEQSGDRQLPMQLEHQQQEAAQPSVTTAAAALDLNSQDLVNQMCDSVTALCADGFEALYKGLRELQVFEGGTGGQRLLPEEYKKLCQGMLALNQAHDAQLFEQLQKFEAHVMQTCLHVPAGVVASAPAPAAQQQQLPWYGGEGAAEAQLAAQAAELARLRAELAMTNQQARRVRRDIKSYDEALQKYGNLSALQSVAGALAGKENAAAEDAAALVTRGTALVGDCAGLESLGRQCAQARAARAPPPKDAAAAERELLQLHPGAMGITANDLRAFQALLSSQ